jgi:hypothetical protein
MDEEGNIALSSYFEEIYQSKKKQAEIEKNKENFIFLVANYNRIHDKNLPIHIRKEAVALITEFE